MGYSQCARIMARQPRRFAAFAVASLGCTPASPTRPSEAPGREQVFDGPRPQPAAMTFPDASALQEDGGEALVDAAPPPVSAMELPAEAAAPPPPGPCDPLSSDPFFHRCPPPPESARDAQRRRLRGSPADVHTPEGAARGYRVHRHCPNYAPGAVAVIGTGTRDIPQLGRALPPSGAGSPVEIQRESWAFFTAVRRVAAVSSIHGGSEAGRPCFASAGGDAVVLFLHDWRQVDRAILNIGSWLAAHDWKGDVILLAESVPAPAYAK
jgi:hypothetical protein